MSCSSTILVAAYGNLLAGGDAFGPLVARELRHLGAPNIEVLDLWQSPASLLDHVEGCCALVIVDAAWWPGCRPGMLLERDWADAERPPIGNERAVSTHGISVADEIELASRLGVLPPVVRVVALMVDPPSIGTAAGSVERQAKVAAERIRQLARDWEGQS